MPRQCSECPNTFIPSRHDQVFCSKECRFADHNRAMQRGREAYRAMYHWIRRKGGPVEEVWVGPFPGGDHALQAAMRWRERQ